MCAPSQKTQELIVLAKNGDKSALNQLYSVYGERVRWMMRLRMGRELRSQMDSMDLAQDTLIHALSGLDDFTYKNEGDFVRWLSKIAENSLRDNLDRLYAGYTPANVIFAEKFHLTTIGQLTPVGLSELPAPSRPPRRV